MPSRSIDDVEQAARRKARHIQKNFRQNVNWRMQMTCDLISLGNGLNESDIKLIEQCEETFTEIQHLHFSISYNSEPNRLLD